MKTVTDGFFHVAENKNVSKNVTKCCYKRSEIFKKALGVLETNANTRGQKEIQILRNCFEKELS